MSLNTSLKIPIPSVSRYRKTSGIDRKANNATGEPNVEPNVGPTKAMPTAGTKAAGDQKKINDEETDFLPRYNQVWPGRAPHISHSVDSGIGTEEADITEGGVDLGGVDLGEYDPDWSSWNNNNNNVPALRPKTPSRVDISHKEINVKTNHEEKEKGEEEGEGEDIASGYHNLGLYDPGFDWYDLEDSEGNPLYPRLPEGGHPYSIISDSESSLEKGNNAASAVAVVINTTTEEGTCKSTIELTRVGHNTTTTDTMTTTTASSSGNNDGGDIADENNDNDDDDADPAMSKIIAEWKAKGERIHWNTLAITKLAALPLQDLPPKDRNEALFQYRWYLERRRFGIEDYQARNGSSMTELILQFGFEENSLSKGTPILADLVAEGRNCGQLIDRKRFPYLARGAKFRLQRARFPLWAQGIKTYEQPSPDQ